MGYPKAMYKGGWTVHKILAEAKTAFDEKQEKELRKKGFVDGNELLAKEPESK